MINFAKDNKHLEDDKDLMSTDDEGDSGCEATTDGEDSDYVISEYEDSSEDDLEYSEGDAVPDHGAIEMEEVGNLLFGRKTKMG